MADKNSSFDFLQTVKVEPLNINLIHMFTRVGINSFTTRIPNIQFVLRSAVFDIAKRNRVRVKWQWTEDGLKVTITLPDISRNDEDYRSYLELAVAEHIIYALFMA